MSTICYVNSDWRRNGNPPFRRCPADRKSRLAIARALVGNPGLEENQVLSECDPTLQDACFLLAARFTSVEVAGGSSGLIFVALAARFFRWASSNR